MKQILLFVILLLLAMALKAQDNGESPSDIKARMATIRKNTDWNDPEAAKEANKQIEDLAVKLTQAIRKQNAQAQQESGQGQNLENQDESNEIKEEVDSYNDQLWNQMMKIAREGGKWDMAKPLRDEIIQEYKDDEDPSIKNADWFKSMPYLLINMSMPHVDAIIDQMPNFKGIKSLIITCEHKGTAVDLENIIRNAQEYPLTELHIINFGSSVTSLPSGISTFKGLTTLSLFNNEISRMPEFISGLHELDTLWVDLNPLDELFSVVSPLHKLKQLSIAKTPLSDTEIKLIENALPDCEIIKQ
jgi:Leucine-rich repeat (LRR) protein